MKTFTSAAEIEFISFSDFIDLVMYRTVQHGSDYVAQYIEQNKCMSIFLMDNETSSYFDEPILQNREIELSRFIDLESRKHQLKLQLSHEYVEYESQPLIHILEDASVRSVINYCEPNYAVNIDKRTWMVVSPEDFEILQSPVNIHSTLICNHKYRNRIYHIKRK